MALALVVLVVAVLGGARLLWLFAAFQLRRLCKKGPASLPEADVSRADPLRLCVADADQDVTKDEQSKPEGSSTTSTSTTELKKVGLVIAHPDDESMFFTPTILNLLRTQKYELHILCFSTGNAAGLGQEREKELTQACSLLGIPESNLEIVDDPMIQDGFHSVGWTPSAMTPYLKSFVGSRELSVLITFDETGASEHPNHKATCLATRHFCEQQLKAQKRSVSLWELKSEPSPVKFIGPVVAIFRVLAWNLVSYFGHTPTERLLLLGSSQTCLSAMQIHKTQWVWFRWLFVRFSSYPLMNLLVSSTHNDAMFTFNAISNKKAD